MFKILTKIGRVGVLLQVHLRTGYIPSVYQLVYLRM
jgi:hypothetical protein